MQITSPRFVPWTVVYESVTVMVQTGSAARTGDACRPDVSKPRIVAAAVKKDFLIRIPKPCCLNTRSKVTTTRG